MTADNTICPLELTKKEAKKRHINQKVYCPPDKRAICTKEECLLWVGTPPNVSNFYEKLQKHEDLVHG
jgi:hypothetical protein